MQRPITWAPAVAEPSLLLRLLVARRQDVYQRAQAFAQGRDAVGDEVARVRMDVLRQTLGVIVHFLEEAADHRPRVLRVIRGVPFERAQKFLADRMVMRMTQRAKARGVERLGLAVQSAQQRPVPM